jgi:hypothetical protein
MRDNQPDIDFEGPEAKTAANSVGAYLAAQLRDSYVQDLAVIRCVLGLGLTAPDMIPSDVPIEQAEKDRIGSMIGWLALALPERAEDLAALTQSLVAVRTLADVDDVLLALARIARDLHPPGNSVGVDADDQGHDVSADT